MICLVFPPGNVHSPPICPRFTHPFIGTGNDPPSLRCEVAFYPATDFTDVELARRFIDGPRAAVMFGQTAEKRAEIARLLSPVCLINKDSTPVYCVHGDKDTTLPVENSRRLFAKGKEVGADIQYLEVTNGNHGFSTECTPTVDEMTAKLSAFVIDRLTK